MECVYAVRRGCVVSDCAIERVPAVLIVVSVFVFLLSVLIPGYPTSVVVSTPSVFGQACVERRCNMADRRCHSDSVA